LEGTTLLLLVLVLHSTTTVQGKPKDDHNPAVVIPREKYPELEGKIPGLQNGMYRSPHDGKLKKVKSISKIISDSSDSSSYHSSADLDDLAEAEKSGSAKPYGSEVDKSEKYGGGLDGGKDGSSTDSESGDKYGGGSGGPDGKTILDMKKVKKMDKIKSSMDIDEDLALEMKREAEAAAGSAAYPSGKESVSDPYETEKDSKPSSNGDLQAQVDRILKMFNASSLDDIVEVKPITNIEKLDSDSDIGPSYKNSDIGSSYKGPSSYLDDSREIPGSYLDDLDSYSVPRSSGYEKLNSGYEESELSPGSEYGLVSGDLGRENNEVEKLELRLKKIINNIEKEEDLLKKEGNLIDVLRNMLAVQEDKIRKIKQLIEDHRNKHIDHKKNIRILYDDAGKVKELIREHLDKLKEVAANVRDNEIKKLESGPEYKVPREYGSKISAKSYKPSYDDNLEESELTSSLYGSRGSVKLPPHVKGQKIRSMRKIKSITDLTEEQALRLKKLQEERNAKRGYSRFRRF